MAYTLVRYFRLSEYSDLGIPDHYWAIIYKLPGDISQRVVFTRAKTMTDELADKAIVLDLAAREQGSPT